MDSTIMVALIGLIGTIFGSLMGAFSMSKFINYRIDELESKVDRNADLLNRMNIAEYRLNEINDYVKDNCE